MLAQTLSLEYPLTLSKQILNGTPITMRKAVKFPRSLEQLRPQWISKLNCHNHQPQQIPYPDTCMFVPKMAHVPVRATVPVVLLHWDWNALQVQHMLTRKDS